MAEQISVSRDTLRAELSDLELRIVDRLAAFQEDKASKKDVSLLNKALVILEARVTVLERWRYAWPSTALVGIAVTVAAIIYTH